MKIVSKENLEIKGEIIPLSQIEKIKKNIIKPKHFNKNIRNFWKNLDSINKNG